jgi:Niemann-Pick C1 protein
VFLSLFYQELEMLKETEFKLTRNHQIFEIYYFRIWLSLIIFASTHALILLPVLLSLVGGRGYVDPESEGGLEQDLRRRQYPALLGEEDSDDD